MSKEFYEMSGKTGYSVTDFCYSLTDHATIYVGNAEEAKKEMVASTLTDFINYLGACGCHDFALLPSDLIERTNTTHRSVDDNALLNVLRNYLASYMFNKRNMVISPKYNLKFDTEYELSEEAKTLFGFLNTISIRCGFNRVFTIRELDDKAVSIEHQKDLDRLKEFLKLTGRYNILLNEENIDVDDVYTMILMGYGLDSVEETGAYFNPINTSLYQRTYMTDEEAKHVYEDIDALCYAFAKSDIPGEVYHDILKLRIKNMKQK